MKALFGGHNAATVAKRKSLLINKDPETLAEGLALLRTCRSFGRKWFVLEGSTQPDVYLETSELIVVIEGKRTEKTITTRTNWMETRHQLLRHLDCAFEQRSGKNVVGFFIVEGEGKGANSLEVPPWWMELTQRTVDPDVIMNSLPHRTLEEQSLIAAGYRGVVTWQRICKDFDISYDQLPDKLSP